MSESQPDEHEPLLRPEDVEATTVYPIIHLIRRDILYYIDTPLTFNALTAPDITYTLVQPLVEKYLAIQRNGNYSIVFCFLLNRVHFLRDDNILTATVSQSRAALCEILAIRTFRDYGNRDIYGNSMLALTRALTTTWPVYNGADPLVLEQARLDRDDDLEERVGNAIEMAILSKSKRFIKSSSCQKVINAIWTGKCVYQAESSHSILSDTYRRRPIHFYDPHRAPLLDHYRLKVPAIRSVLEYLNFLILFILFVIAIEVSERDKLCVPEVIFMIYSLGFTLERVAAMQEHGIKVYFKGTWNGFDLAFVTIFAIYGTLRLYGSFYDCLWARELGIDFLAVIACLLFPRLAFVTLKDNLMVLSLRAMMTQFTVLMLIAMFCFGGFLYALWTLGRNNSDKEELHSPGQIAWWMLYLWFGLDATGFSNAENFHQFFGPILLVTYACLSNTLLLTVLVSILSNTFATINEDAAAEAMFRKAVSTIEGVKADFLFSYQPPINLFALCIMLPASYVLTPRWFHKVNVLMIRITSFPILLAISIYERQSKRSGTIGFYETIAAIAEKILDALPRQLKRFTFFEGLVGSDADINAIFEIEEEFESALDTSDAMSYQHSEGFRRMSLGPAQHTQLPHSPQITMSRLRSNSLMPRGLEGAQNFVSPLAQVFSPLVVVDRPIPEESDQADEDKTPSSSSPMPPPAAVSYGPASRRRISMVSLRGQRPASPPHRQQVKLRKFSTFPKSSSPPRMPLLHSPEAIEEPDPESPASPEVVTEALVERRGEHPDSIVLERRLDEMEKRQERIEELLKQIARDIKN
ncbi:hypothetical protein E4T56_gene7242 [Termitomyces sp. T112]|nr:hypothetical protein E4T56_gene7242 [Termitomyces sp. T112]